MLLPTESTTIGLVLSGKRITCVVNPMDSVLLNLTLLYSDRVPSISLPALSPSPMSQVQVALLPLPGLASTVTRAPMPYSCLLYSLLSPRMGPLTKVERH